jgi:hypothetical protein
VSLLFRVFPLLNKCFMDFKYCFKKFFSHKTSFIKRRKKFIFSRKLLSIQLFLIKLELNNKNYLKINFFLKFLIKTHYFCFSYVQKYAHK